MTVDLFCSALHYGSEEPIGIVQLWREAKIFICLLDIDLETFQDLGDGYNLELAVFGKKCFHNLLVFFL
jgi:hypothetical protein